MPYVDTPPYPRQRKEPLVENHLRLRLSFGHGQINVASLSSQVSRRKSLIATVD